MSYHSRRQRSSLVSNLQPPTSDQQDRCTYTTSDGRRCVSLRAAEGYPFCATHAMIPSLPDPQPARPPRIPRLRDQKFQPLEEDVASEFLGVSDDFSTPAAINRALRRVVILLAGNRISARRAAVLAYTFQLLLQSLSDVRHEVEVAHDYHGHKEEFVRVVDQTTPLREKRAHSNDIR